MRKFILAAAALAAFAAAPAFAMGDGNMLQRPVPAFGFSGASVVPAGQVTLNQGEGAQMQAVRPASGTTGTVGAKISTGAFQFNQGFGQG